MIRSSKKSRFRLQSFKQSVIWGYDERWRQIDANRWYQLAIEKYEVREYKQAAELLSNVIIYDPDHINALQLRAIVYVHLGEYPEAIQDLEKISKLAPTRNTSLQLAGILLLVDRIEEAKAIFLELLSHDENDAIAKKGIGDIYFKQQNFKDALQTYHEVLERNGQDPDIWYAIAETHYRAQDHEAAMKSIENAISIEPRAEFFAFKADFYIRHDNFERALEQYVLAKNMDPNDPEIYLRLGFIYRVLDRLKDANHAFDDCLRIDPENIPALENKYQVLQSLGREDQAFNVLQQLAIVKPEKYALELAHFFMDDEEYGSAYKLFVYLTEQMNTQESWYGRAYSAFKTDQMKDALSAIDTAISIEDSPEYQELRNLIVDQKKEADH